MTPRPTCRCARARLAVPRYLRWAGGTCVPGRLRGGSSVQPCAGVMQLPRSTSNPSNDTRHSPAFLKARLPPPPIQQLTTAHCTSGKETQRGPTPQHGNQIRIHAVSQGGPLPVLPDLGAERSHQVSKPIRAPRGWSIGTSCSRRPRHGQPLRGGLHMDVWEYQERERVEANTMDPPGRSSRNLTRP